MKDSERSVLNVELGERSYPIHIARDLLGNSELIREFISGPQVMVVSNVTVAPLYLDLLLKSLSGFKVTTHILPDGEEPGLKSLAIATGNPASIIFLAGA